MEWLIRCSTLAPFFHRRSWHERYVSFCLRPSYVVNFNLLLGIHWAKCSQTLVEWYLYGPLSKFCPLIPTSNQDGHQAKNRKRG